MLPLHLEFSFFSLLILFEMQRETDLWSHQLGLVQGEMRAQGRLSGCRGPSTCTTLPAFPGT